MSEEHENPLVQFITLLLAFVAYALLVHLGYPYLGNIAASAAVFPVMVVGWQTGLGGGMLAAMASIPLNLAMLLLAGSSPREAPLQVLFSTLIVCFCAISAGYISETRKELLKEIRLREAAEKALHYLNARLEGKVQTRTRQLTNLNSQLTSELQARKRAQAGLKYRETILETIAGIAEDTLKADKYIEPIPDILKSLGRAAHAQRVRLFENVPRRDSTQSVLVLRKEWVASEARQHPRGPQRLNLEEHGLQRWQVQLAAGQPVRERLPLGPGAKRGSLLATPIFVGAQWWGGISLASLDRPRRWGGAELDLLRAVADILGAHIQRELEYERTLLGWARALELRDEDTEGHTQRVAHLAVEFAETLGYSDSDITDVRRGALLHDIGKMGVPDAILNKPGKLTENEWRIMRRHPLYARDMLAPIVFLHSALPIPYAHHERWNGSGYPRRLKGKRIPAAARLFALVDVWDALTSDRPYRLAWSAEKAAQYLREHAGILFDPHMTPAFLQMMTELGELPAKA
ncbi:MAG: HD domain-containing protein [Anaerolineales bacterium]|jgi:putative nucleotidyltransferase with HDIG domain|nr:HD domain-containing protein [Anaerolineales bacterium]MCW5838986.1 HD domain-containing protein [Anaerolineales bacterium]